MTAVKFTVPGIKKKDAGRVIEILSERLVALIDLELTLKHIHWNVVGPNFIAVHEMLDPQVDACRAMVDTLAERIATLGGTPQGTPGAVVKNRDWSDYSLGRAQVEEHLGALDVVYSGLNESHRKALAAVADIDPVSEDILTGQLADLELNQWFIRAHLESSSGKLATEGKQTEKGAAKASKA